MKELLKVENLTVYYGYVSALQKVSIQVNEGEIITLIGGNGAGKTTTLMSISNLVEKTEGRIAFKGQDITRMAPDKIVKLGISHVPEGRKIFPQLTVYENLIAGTFGKPGISKERTQQLLERNFALFPRLKERTKQAGGSLSGGEQQRAALAKVLLAEPEILLLDEPTKGLDNYFKQRLARILKKLTENGVTIIMVSHDVEFCGKYGDVCAMFFDGNIVTTNTPKRFFSGNSFYTTAANRMSRHIFENAVTVEDVVNLCESNLNANDPGRESKRKAEQGKVQK